MPRHEDRVQVIDVQLDAELFRDVHQQHDLRGIQHLSRRANQGVAIVPLLDAFSFDSTTAHWDFAWAPQHLKELVRRL